MNTLSLVLLGIVIYSVLGTVLYYTNRLPTGLKILGPITIYRSQFGIKWVDTTAKKYQTNWHRYGTAGAIIAGISVVFSTLLVLISGAYALLYPRPETAITDPVNMLVIPGVNDFLPLSVAPHIIVGLVVGMIIHEGGHAIMCRIDNMSIKSVGTLSIAVIPLGAFVEPDESSVKNSSRAAKLRMYAGGVMNNFIISIILLAILLVPIAGAFSVAPGGAVAGTVPGSPAETAGLEKGDRITHVNGTEIENNSQFQSSLDTHSQSSLELTLSSGEHTTLDRTVTVRAAAEQTGLSPGTTLTHVNETPVNTTADVTAAVTNTRLATFQTASGQTTTLPVGVLSRAHPDTPAATAGIPTDRTVTITAIDETPTQSPAQLNSILSGYSPGDTVRVEVYENNTFTTYTVTLGGQNTTPVIGVSTAPGINGLQLDDNGVELYPAEQYLDLFKHGQTDGNIIGNSIWGHVLLLLQFPAAGAAGVLPYNFAGFVDGIQNFYTVTGPLSLLGSGTVFGLANMLFWVAWVNINLAIFNCIPTYPLDGGHIAREIYGHGAEKLPVEPSTQHTITRIAMYATMLVMGAGLYLLIFGV